MIAKFWDALGGKLADRWMTLGGPALVFWVGASLAWSRGRGGFDSLSIPARWLEGLPLGAQVAALAVGIGVVAASAIAVERVTTPALKLMEGYWPALLRPLAEHRAERFRKEATRLIERSIALEAALRSVRAHPHDVVRDEKEYAEVTTALRRLPARAPYLPTAIGNTMRAAERRPEDKYGLNAVMVWAHLWLVMPETTRSEVKSSRAALDGTVAACCWGVLFTVFSVWTLWALPVGLGVAALAGFVWVPSRAQVFADLVEAAFDLHRAALYTHLRWPLPENPNIERVQGRLISTYLVRGLAGTSPTFVSPSSEP